MYTNIYPMSKLFPHEKYSHMNIPDSKNIAIYVKMKFQKEKNMISSWQFV